jgi:hypothetical protein
VSGGYIIVERDILLKDCGVFTGQIQIISTRLRFHDNGEGFQAPDGVSSPHIEHAFVFHCPGTAWRHAMNFEPHWDESRKRYWAFRRWVVRSDGQYWPGESAHIQAPIGPSVGNMNVRELIMRASLTGFEQGYESARRELL